MSRAMPGKSASWPAFLSPLFAPHVFFESPEEVKALNGYFHSINEGITLNLKPFPPINGYSPTVFGCISLLKMFGS